MEQTWGEQIEKLSPHPICVLCLATSGLKPQEHTTLAVAYKAVTGEDAGNKGRTVIHRVNLDILMQGIQYHGISREWNENGLSDSEFAEKVDGILKSHTCFTYNPKFQVSFLEAMLGRPVVLYDLPQFLKAAEMRIPLNDEDLGDLPTLSKAAANLYKTPPAFKQLCKVRGIHETSSLPVAANGKSLVTLWTQLASVPLMPF